MKFISISVSIYLTRVSALVLVVLFFLLCFVHNSLDVIKPLFVELSPTHFSAFVDPVGVHFTSIIWISSVAVTYRTLSGSGTFFPICISTMSFI